MVGTGYLMSLSRLVFQIFFLIIVIINTDLYITAKIKSKAYFGDVDCND